jgi:hypothetical protein
VTAGGVVRVAIYDEHHRGACCHILGIREAIRWKHSDESGVVVEGFVACGPMLKLLGRGHYLPIPYLGLGRELTVHLKIPPVGGAPVPVI